MKVRPLVIDDEAKAKVARVVAYAMDHPYRKGQPPPGDNPSHVAELDTYTAVFSFTHARGKVFRHLTVSVPAEGKYPHPVATFTIAQLFGFTGYNDKEPFKPGPWLVGVNHEERCVSLMEAIT